MSNWLIAIVGGAIATVVGGLILFYLLPSQRAPGLSSSLNVSAPSDTGIRHLKCTMKGGAMDGRVYTFSFNMEKKRAAWTDEGENLRIREFGVHRIYGETLLPVTYGPKHDYIAFSFNRVTLAMRATLLRNPSPEEVAECQRRWAGKGVFCDLALSVGEETHGTCAETARAF